MNFRIVQAFRAPPPAVEAAYFDPAFIASLSGLPKIGQAELLDQRVEGDVVHQRVRYVFVGALSSAVRAVVDPKKLSWVQDATHDRLRHETTWQIVPDHYPDRLSCRGVSTFSAQADGTRRDTDADMKVHVALVGGRVERAIVSGLQEHAAAEAEALERFLATGG